MCIELPNGMRIMPRRDKDGYILHWDRIKAMGEIPVSDLKPHPVGEDTCLFVDNEPDKVLSPYADFLRENLRDVTCHAAHQQGWFKEGSEWRKAQKKRQEKQQKP